MKGQHQKQSFKPNQQKAHFSMHHPNTQFRHQNRGGVAGRIKQGSSR